jgi:subtilisin family serine protease
MVADARASGILWVNAAGNEADTHWSGTFSSSGGSIHEFAPGDVGNTFVWRNGESICGFLKWDEWPAAASDFDLGLFLSGANVLLAQSSDPQGSGQPPFEAICGTQATGSDLQVFWAIRGSRVASQPRLDLISWSGPLQYATPAGSVTEPASSAAAFSVGALCWQSHQLEPYSSQGPTIDGRTKPDIAGHDSVSGETYGSFYGCPSGFSGTSAAAPEVAGAAALVQQAYPKWGPAEIEAFLEKAATDIGPAGADNLTGAGELHLPDPPDVTAPSAKALSGSGRAGAAVKLRSVVSDDSGQVAVLEQVKKKGRVVATIQRNGVRASQATTVASVWKALQSATGHYQHCVRASDAAGNSSSWSCAPVALRGTR